MFYPDFAKRMLDRRAKRIPELMENRKNGRIAYFVKDKVVVKTGRPPARLSKDSTSSSGEVTINIHGSSVSQNDNIVSLCCVLVQLNISYFFSVHIISLMYLV